MGLKDKTRGLNTNRYLQFILHADCILSDMLLPCSCKRATNGFWLHIYKLSHKSGTQYFPPFKLVKRRIQIVLIYITCLYINPSDQL